MYAFSGISCAGADKSERRIESTTGNATIEDADFIELFIDEDAKTLILKPTTLRYIA